MPNSTFFRLFEFELSINHVGTVFYQTESEYTETLLNQFPDPRDGVLSFCNVDDNNHVDRNKPPYPPNYEQKPLTSEDFAETISMNRKDPLPEWKMSRHNGDHLHWPEWCGPFVSAADYARLSDDIKLTY